MAESLLRTIVAVKDADGKVSDTAGVLGVTQPRVSQLLKEARERYGEIFVPGSRYRKLTPLGQRFYDCGKALVTLEHELASPAVSKTEREIVRVGYSRTHLALVAAAMSYVVKPRGGGLKVCSFEISVADDVKGMLWDRRIDVGVTYPPEEKPKWLTEKPIAQLPLALVVTREHKLANRDHVTPDDLRDEPLALLRPKTALRKAVDKYFGRQKPSNVVLEADAATALLALARYGVATILPAFPQSTAFAVIPLSHPPFETSVLWRKNNAQNQSILLFVDALKDAAVETINQADDCT